MTKLLSYYIVDAGHLLHLPGEILVHQHLLYPTLVINALEVAPPDNLQSHRFHQSALGEEQISTVEEFAGVAGHDHIVATLTVAEQGVGSSRAHHTGQFLYFAGQGIDGVTV